jgi:hypothetical protein
VSSPDVRFVIVPHRPRTRMLVFLAAIAWLGSLWATFELARWVTIPTYAEMVNAQDRLVARLAEVSLALDQERQRSAVLGRSDQISRAANLELQQTLRERDEEIAALRTDTAFYERLVGGSAQRQGLAVHALTLSKGGGGDIQYALTLTQTLKRSGLTEGEVTLEVDGIAAGKLTTLDWTTLRQGTDSAPQAFGFRYFQQLEGSIMLPEGFTPHRVKVQVQAGGNRADRVFSWQEVLPQQGA